MFSGDIQANTFYGDGAGLTNVSGSSTTFLELTDTPADYTGHAGKSAVVKGDETGLEFTTISGGGGSSQWSTHGNGIYYDSGNVGIGVVPDATNILTVSGTTHIITASAGSITPHTNADDLIVEHS